MPLFCEIDSSLNFSIEIMIDSGLLKQPLSQLFKTTIVTATQINKEYAHFMTKEGKILGQERIQLVESLDSLFILLVILRIRLEKSLSVGVSLKECRAPIEMKFNKFVIQGKLERDDLYGIENFNVGYESLILEKIKELLVKYKQALQDNQVQIQKIEELYLTFDDVFYNSIAMRYNIENCLIDR